MSNGRYRAYPEYKDSGLQRLDSVPTHWAIKRLKHSVRLVTNKTAKRENPVALENIESWTGRFIATETEFQGDGVAFDKGDILFGKLRPYLAKAYRAESTGEAVGDFHVLRPAVGIDGRYAQYLILNREFITEVDGSTYGSKMPRAGWEFVGAMAVTIPPLPEQTQIATFLDHETTKIDRLIEKQEELIRLLKEKRQAVISHAVTKGLNPHAPLKDSGIAWLGQVPAHWEILKGGHLGTLFGSEPIPDESVVDEGRLPFIKVGSLSSESFAIESWDWFVEKSAASRVQPSSNYLVFPKRGAAIFLNKVNFVERPSVIDPNLMGWEINCRAEPMYLAYILKCRRLEELADVSTVPQINNKHITPERFPVPPFAEQTTIVQHLDLETAKFDELTTNAEEMVTLLQERRTALI